MFKPKMANNLQRILVFATVVSAIMLTGPGEADDSHDSGPNSDGGSPGVLPVATASPGESGMVDANNRAVTEGLFGLIAPVIWPATYAFLRVFNFILRVFIGQKLPCTLWSVAPPRMQCSLLE